MKTFQDLMKEHPLVVTQNTNQHIGTNDTLTRWYNMHWGALTDTHMQLMDDDTYLITGSKLTKTLWEQIVYCRRLSTAPNTCLPHTFDEVLRFNHLTYCSTKYNGAPAIVIAHEENKDGGVKSIRIPMATNICSSRGLVGQVGPCDDGICV